MRYTIPDYYREFQCAAGDCPATCCAGWQIVIDEASLARYRKCRTPLGSRLANSIDWSEGTFKQYHGRCAFLDERGLCDLISEGGPELLCRTCRKYPRHMEEFENERELSFSLSCPQAARMILAHETPVRFLSGERGGSRESDPDFDELLYSVLQDCRKVMLGMLQNRREPVCLRVGKVLALGHDVQNRMDGRQLFEIEPLLSRYQTCGSRLNAKLISKINQKGSRTAFDSCLTLLELLDSLEVLDASWPVQIREDQKLLRAFLTDWGTVLSENETEQLMVYFIYTYFCGAVYDGDAFSKVKMAVVSTLIIRLLECAEYLRRKHVLKAEPEQCFPGLEDRARIAWRYSRELEHSDLNLNRMEQLMTERPAASFETLLGCLRIFC